MQFSQLCRQECEHSDTHGESQCNPTWFSGRRCLSREIPITGHMLGTMGTWIVLPKIAGASLRSPRPLKALRDPAGATSENRRR